MKKCLKVSGSSAAAVAASVVISCLAVAPAYAQDFYKGKTISISTGFGVGGGFDNYLRVVAQHLGDHIPGNPAIKPVNRPGAGGRTDANLLYASDPKDGTFLALLGPWLATEPLFGVDSARFDSSKFNWLISMASDVSTCMFWKKSGISTFDDLKKKGEVTTGSSGPTATQTTDALLLNAIFGTKIKVVHGFKGTNESFLAAERGELDGVCGMWVSSVNSSFSAPLKSGDANVVVQLGTWRHPDFPKATHVFEDLKPSPEDAQAMRLVLAQLDMARPFAAPPDVPADRIEILRKAFESLAKDPKFLETAQKRQLEVKPVSGARIQQMIAELYAAPKHIVERAKKIGGY